jgi:hypothetical protein
MPSRFLEASREALGRARQAGFVVAHVHIAFSPDYADLPKNGRLFRKVVELGAVKLALGALKPMRASSRFRPKSVSSTRATAPSSQQGLTRSWKRAP